MRRKSFILVIIISLLVGCSRTERYTLQGYIEGEYTNLSSNLSGRLIKRYVSRGQSVSGGQLMFQLDPEPELSEYKKALSNLAGEKSKLKDYLMGQRNTVLAGIIAQREQAQAELDLARNNFNRTKQLCEKGVVSKATYDQALADLKNSEQKVNQFEQNLKEAEQGERVFRILQQTQQVKSSEADLAEAKWRLIQKTVFAPESGFIFDTFFNDGEQIPANQPVVALLAPRYIRLIFYVPEPLRARLRINEAITFECDGCAEKFTATINYISPQAEYTPPVIFSRESRMKLVYRVQAKLSLKTAQSVLPGQPVDVHIVKKSSKTFGESLWMIRK